MNQFVIKNMIDIRSKQHSKSLSWSAAAAAAVAANCRGKHISVNRFCLEFKCQQLKSTAHTILMAKSIPVVINQFQHYSEYVTSVISEHDLSVMH